MDPATSPLSFSQFYASSLFPHSLPSHSTPHFSLYIRSFPFHVPFFYAIHPSLTVLPLAYLTILEFLFGRMQLAPQPGPQMSFLCVKPPKQILLISDRHFSLHFSNARERGINVWRVGRQVGEETLPSWPLKSAYGWAFMHRQGAPAVQHRLVYGVFLVRCCYPVILRQKVPLY